VTAYSNTVKSTSLHDAIGAPTLGASDEVFVGGGENQDTYTADLNGLGSTAIAGFYVTPEHTSQIGDGESPLLINADVMVIEGGGRSYALKGNDSNTVDRFDWSPVNNAAGSIGLYSSITLLRVMGAGLLSVLGDAVFVDGEVHPGCSIVAMAGTAATSLTVAGSADLYRDVGTLSVERSGVARCRSTAVTPTTVNVRGGRVELQGSTVTINVSAGSVVDFSKARSDLTVTWNVTGPFTMIDPPSGVSVTAPPATARVTRRPASAAA
jgi:hypothetical protein